MARLKNELSWSRTRMGTIKSCHRMYYYQYYLKWEGWSWDAPDDRKKAYFFSKMTNLPMLVGHAVHETIKQMLLDLQEHGEVRVEDPGFYLRKNYLAKTWQEAAKKLEEVGADRIWQQNPKQVQPVYEIYYDEKPDGDVLKNMGAKAAAAIDVFLKSSLFEELRTEDKSGWLAVDPEPSFDESTKHKLDGRTIWALPDFARKNAAGECEIWDWKTGTKSPNDELQLLSYALYARDKWGFNAEQIRLFGFYLKEGEISEYPCNSERLQYIEDEIRKDFKTMTTLIVAGDENHNTPLPADQAFLQIEESSPTCQHCFYKELCGR